MSEEATTVVEATTNGAPQGVSFEVVPFRAKGDAEGFSFTTKIYTTLDAALADLGQEATLDILNAEVQARLGMKARANAGFTALSEVPASNRLHVRNNLVQTLTTKYPSKVIFGESEALAWKPNVRELSLSGIQKKINEAYKAGDMEQFNLWVGQLQAAAQRQQERVQAGL